MTNPTPSDAPVLKDPKGHVFVSFGPDTSDEDALRLGEEMFDALQEQRGRASDV